MHMAVLNVHFKLYAYAKLILMFSVYGSHSRTYSDLWFLDSENGYSFEDRKICWLAMNNARSMRQGKL